MSNLFDVLSDYGSDEETQQPTQKKTTKKTIEITPPVPVKKATKDAKPVKKTAVVDHVPDAPAKEQRPRGERGERGGRGARRGGPRNFDRHDRSGRTKGQYQKREGHGAGNWGTATEGSWEQNQEQKPAAATEGTEQTEQVEKVEEVPQEAVEPVEEEGPKTLSLDEYLAAQASSKAKLELPKARKAGEGEDNKQWKNTVVLARETEEVVEYEEVERRQQRKRQTVDIDVQISARENFGRDSRRGGRGGSRGGRGGNRGGRQEGGRQGGGRAKIDVSSVEQFPSLS